MEFCVKISDLVRVILARIEFLLLQNILQLRDAGLADVLRGHRCRDDLKFSLDDKHIFDIIFGNAQHNRAGRRISDQKVAFQLCQGLANRRSADPQFLRKLAFADDFSFGVNAV